MQRTRIPALALAAAAVALTGCAHSLIAGTNIPDTDDNRAVLAVLAELRQAMVDRDATRITELVSTAYFEDMGTPDPDDDYGFYELSTQILPRSMEIAKEVFVDFQIHDVVVDGDRAWADLRYKSRARLDLPTGTQWDKHEEFNRVELAREDGAWRITAGL